MTGLILSALMVLFPPWLYYDGNTSNQRSAGYHFLFSPPHIKTYDEMFGFDDDMPTQYVRVRLNVIRLITQLLTLAFLVMGLDLKLQRDSPGLSGCLLAQGTCGILLLILLMSSKF
ncbi:MAG: hypothetical protein AABO57_11870 [Acidobacteriota bacterium]